MWKQNGETLVHESTHHIILIQNDHIILIQNHHIILIQKCKKNQQVFKYSKY